MTDATGSEFLCRGLAEHGARTVFGLPGTQNVPVFEALRRSGIRTVVPVHELGAAFAACGWGRATGTPGVVLTIPGPGFAWALPALAEASHDSTPLLLIVAGCHPSDASPLRLQWLDQAAMARPVVRACFRASTARDVQPELARAWHAATAGEPGPVLLEIEEAAFAGAAPPVSLAPPAPLGADPADVEEVAQALATAARPLLFVGQGVGPSAEGLTALAERLGAPVATTLSARGAIPEDHPLAIAADLGGPGVEHVNALADRADLVLALGARFSHNGTGGFRLRLPSDRLIRVDRSTRLLELGPPAVRPIHADVPSFVGALLAHPDLATGRAAWAAARMPPVNWEDEPAVSGTSIGTPAELMGLLRELLPRDARLVTDSGRHQVLVRRHFPVLAPGGLVAPSDFQSMGFALAAAVGAALATPDRKTVVVLGDGGLMMSGLELLTAVRERLPLLVVVPCDGAYGLIRDQQLRDHGTAFGTDLPDLGLEALADAVGASYRLLEGDARAVLAEAMEQPGPVLVEVRLGETAARRRAAAAAHARAMVRSALPESLLARLRRLLGRG